MMTGGPMITLTPALTADSKPPRYTRVLTVLSRPAGLTNTLPRLSVTLSTVHTLTSVLTVRPEATCCTFQFTG